MKTLQIPKDVSYIIETLEAAGHEAYIVGGCVRDMVLGIKPKDYDITTSAEPMQVKDLFERTIDTGLAHGTVTIMMDKEGYEVTTYRVDGTYEDHRRPTSVNFTKSLEEDLLRRDFTINAMAYNHRSGIVDLYDGIGDLERGLIRCVGQATARFNEDALRMLRAIRFAARFRFEIEATTILAIKDLSHLIKKISAERIHMELTQTLCSNNPDYMGLLVTYGLLQHIIPEFIPCVGLQQNHPYHIYPVDQHVYECLKHTPQTEAMRWAIYLHDIGKGTTRTTDAQGVDHFKGHPKVSVALSKKILKRLKFDNKTRDLILFLIETHDVRFEANKKSVRRAMAKMTPERFLDYLTIQEADMKGQAPDKLALRLEDLQNKRSLYEEIMEEDSALSIKELMITGTDLLNIGIPSGQSIGQCLNYLLDLVLEDPDLNDQSVLLQKAKVWLETEKEG